MKKETGKFKKVPEYINVCDECGKELNLLDTYIYDFTWSDGYDRFGDDWEFCSMECLIKYMKDYMKDTDDTYYIFPGGETVTLNIPSMAMKKLLLGE